MWIIKELIRGLLLTLRYLVSKAVTIQYPKRKRILSSQFRGKPVHEAKLCLVCGLCESVCPSEAIEIEAYEDEEGNRKLKYFNLNMGRCVFCGICAEYCPEDAIKLTQDYELATLSKQNTILYSS
jgi:NADH-quinone oxidoreductase subunit I